MSTRREELEKTKVYEVYRRFELQWYPNKDVDTAIDFLLWLEKNGYEVMKTPETIH